MTLFFLFFALIADARTFDQCGTYEAQGFLTKQDNKIYFLLEKDTRSEIKIELLQFPEEKNHIYLETKIKMRFDLEKMCFYQCASTKYEILELLAPYLKPKPFLVPRTAPLKLLECRK